MKLISMTDFCLEVLNENPPYNEVEMLTKISNYANFLKQPLTLGMFVPLTGNDMTQKQSDKAKEFFKAKEKVLFEGFEVPSDEWYKDTKTVVNKSLEIILYLDTKQISKHQPLGIGYGEANSVEDLHWHDLELTPSALKQIGL